MSTTAIIGGTGLSKIDGLEITGRKQLTTPYGNPSADYVLGRSAGTDVIFLARHGNPHSIPPHRINYRANLWGLKELGATTVIAAAAVGGITHEMSPGRIVIPTQLIDYSYGREHTFFADELDQVTHIDFSHPYHEPLRRQLLEAATKAGIPVCDQGVYGCTQGPRLESIAEIQRMQRDGCDLVGMTGMPEAALARELELDYAACAVIANWAAGKSENIITMAEIERNLEQGMNDMLKLLHQYLLHR